MAMEHFDERIAPSLKHSPGTNSSPNSPCSSPGKFQSPAVYLKGFPGIFASSSSSTPSSNTPQNSPASFLFGGGGGKRTPNNLTDDKCRLLSKRLKKLAAESKKNREEADQSRRDQSAEITNLTNSLTRLETLVAAQGRLIRSQSDMIKKLQGQKRPKPDNDDEDDQPLAKRTRRAKSKY